MTVRERAAYLKGLAEGMQLDTTKPEGKLISEILDLITDMTVEMAGTQKTVGDMMDYLREMDDDLTDLEDLVWGEEDDEEDEDEYEDDEDDEDYDDEDEPYFYEAVCPACGDTVCFDDSIDPENVTCPNCGEVFICEFECDGNCEGCDGCDDAEESEDSAE